MGGGIVLAAGEAEEGELEALWSAAACGEAEDDAMSADHFGYRRGTVDRHTTVQQHNACAHSASNDGRGGVTELPIS